MKRKQVEVKICDACQVELEKITRENGSWGEYCHKCGCTYISYTDVEDDDQADTADPDEVFFRRLAEMKKIDRSLTKILVDAGISHSRDGLLHDMIARQVYKEAIKTARSAIIRREKEIEVLRFVVDALEDETQ